MNPSESLTSDRGRSGLGFGAVAGARTTPARVWRACIGENPPRARPRPVEIRVAGWDTLAHSDTDVSGEHWKRGERSSLFAFRSRCGVRPGSFRTRMYAMHGRTSSEGFEDPARSLPLCLPELRPRFTGPHTTQPPASRASGPGTERRWVVQVVAARKPAVALSARATCK